MPLLNSEGVVVARVCLQMLAFLFCQVQVFSCKVRVRNGFKRLSADAGPSVLSSASASALFKTQSE